VNKKIAVVLFNLGGPSDLKQVKSFLFNLFYDKNIITLPNPFRWFLAKLISNLRENYAKEIYKKIGNKSPILEQTIQQAQAIHNKLISFKDNNNYKIIISMRYAQPFSEQAIEEIKNFAADEIIALPLYPQFSTTTTKSSLEDFYKSLKKHKIDIPVKAICCYFDNEDFIKSHIKLLDDKYQQAHSDGANKIKILFSAHSLPQKIIDNGDPYEWQIIQTVKKIIDNFAVKNIDYSICYQSKVGRLKWLEPSTEKSIIENACSTSLIIVPIAFVSEHSETLVELDMDYKQIANNNGCKNYYRVPTLAINDIFVESLAKIIIQLLTLASEKTTMVISSNDGIRKCPNEFCGCINNYKN
jgi:ferrochelatase